MPALVIIEICRPVPCPTDESKFDDSTRISRWCRRWANWRCAGRCRYWTRRRSRSCRCRRRRPRCRPRSLAVPSTNPCDTRLWLADGFTPEENRVSMTGHVREHLDPSTIRLSKFSPGRHRYGSSSGASAVTDTCSLSCPMSSLSDRLIDSPHGEHDARACQGLEVGISTATWELPGCRSGTSK